MKKLSKLKLKEFQELSGLEMRNVIGGYAGSENYPRCKKTGCLVNSNCSNNVCTNWKDCPSIPTYGTKRCS